MVSVIVPVYNVERYLRQCLDSLKFQTLGNVEFIIIDDGSTDASGWICDEYKSDLRFRIIHTENRGLSAARNRGIEESRGKWIMFVDSDDWVEPVFCEIPLKAAIENNADLVMFQRVNTTELGKVKKNRNVKPIPIGIITQEKAIDYGGAAAWNKLYKKSLFSEIRYPEGHVYEDIATTHKLIYSASCNLMIYDMLYYHRKREGSITQEKTIESTRDEFSFRLQRYHDLVRFGYPEKKERERLQLTALKYCIRMEPSDDPLFQSAERILSETEVFSSSWYWEKNIGKNVEVK